MQDLSPGRFDVLNPVRSARFATFLRTRARYVLAIFLLLIIVAAWQASSVSSKLGGGGWYVADSQSDAAVRAVASAKLDGRGASEALLVIRGRNSDASSSEFVSAAREIRQDIEQTPELKVRGFYGWSSISSPTLRAGFVGSSGRTVVDSVAIDADDDDARSGIPTLQKRLDAKWPAQGFDVAIVSPAALWGEVTNLSAKSLGQAELVTFPLLAITLLVIFGSFAAAALALGSGIVAIILTLGIISPIARYFDVSVFVENSATMLGLGIAIDYSLFIIARYRRELGSSGKDAAIAATLRTSGHTVLFSGVTVTITMATMFVVPLNVVRSLALGATTVVVAALVTTLILLPTILILLGDKINVGSSLIESLLRRLGLRKFGPEGGESITMKPGGQGQSRWYRFADVVTSRPRTFMVGVLIVLAALTIPAFGLKVFTADARIVPSSSTVRSGYDTIQNDFGVGVTSPIRVVVQGVSLGSGEPAAAISKLISGLQTDPRIGSVTSSQRYFNGTRIGSAGATSASDNAAIDSHFLSSNQRTLVIDVSSKYRSSDERTFQLVRDIRQNTASNLRNIPGISGTDVGGETAEGLDSSGTITSSMPWLLVLILASVFILMLVTFRSVLIAIMTVVANAFSVGAVFGVLVLVFQHGWLSWAGFENTASVQNFVPVLLLAILIGLSTDYQVFLLDRVRERHEAHGFPIRAINEGVDGTGRLITGAALLMIIVFGAFATTGLMPIEQLGLGLAVAILIDATLIRMILMPSMIAIAGRRAWPSSRSDKTTNSHSDIAVSTS